MIYMPNPFKHKDAMLPIASVNSVVIHGKRANDLFRPELIQKDLLKLAERYAIKLEQTDIQHLMESLFKEDNPKLREELISIGYLYGERLALVLKALINPDDEIKNENLRWKDEHWAYWKSIKQIYLMGGLASSPYQPLFMEKVLAMQKENNLSHVKIEIIKSSQEKALEGMLYKYDSGHFLLFDFGQTSIKRAYVVLVQGMILTEKKLSQLPAKYLEVLNENELTKDAFELERYIEDVIIDSYREVQDDSCQLLMSIANYVRDGVLNPAKRSYGILSVLADNYQDYLEERLSFRLKRKVRAILEHDATAMSHVVPQVKHTAVITLGTAFGISFID